MNGIDILGFCAAFCTTISFLPQAIKVIRSRDTSSLSLAMYTIFTLGVSLWLAYGLYKQDLAMILANIITLILATVILATKIVNDVIAKRHSSTH